MQVPALIVAGSERVQIIFEAESPGLMNRVAIRALLVGVQLSILRGAMRTDRQNVGRAVGQMNSSAGERDQHHLTREITSGMTHRLVGRGDTGRRRVIVNAKVNA